MGTTGVAQSLELQNFMAAQPKVVIFFVMLSFRGGKESVGFKKVLELIWALLSSIASFAKRGIK